jgi:hypothetical protein
MTLPKGFKEKEKEEESPRYIIPTAEASPPPQSEEQQQQQRRYSNKVPGQDEKSAGKFFIITGIVITVLTLFDYSLEWSLLGFFLSILGTALYIHGNRKQGNDTTIVGFGFASFDTGV